MNRSYHLVKLIAFFLLSALAFTQTNPRRKKSTSEGAVCPLSLSQVQKSVEAFDKIADVFLLEPRCFNCHGGVNPYFEGIAPQTDSGPYTSPHAHGGGKMDPPVEDPYTGKITSKGTDCESCHDDMAPKTNGSPSKWRMPEGDDRFLGEDERSLCRHMKSTFQEIKDFIGHLKDDNGIDNFVGTAFKGNRGLTASAQEKSFKLEPPARVTHAGLIGLGNNWGASTGGEFKGDTECGCAEPDPPRYAIRLSQSNIISLAGIQRTTIMKPVDIPITFEDDGSFTGDADAAYESSGSGAGCAQQSTIRSKLHVSGQATEQYQKNFMHLELEYQSPLAGTFSLECPDDPNGNSSVQANFPMMNLKAFFDLQGKSSELINRNDDSTPGIISNMSLQIIDLNNPPR